MRFATLGSQSLWLDEAYTVGIVRDGFGHLVHQIPRTESTPPLYYVLAWVWAKAFGTGAAGLRSLSALFGTATVAVAHRLGRDLGGVRAGLVGAALVAFDPLLVWYSQEVRAYALLVLLGLGTLVLWLRALGTPTGRRLLAWGACCAAALATHYFAIFLVGPEIALLAWLRRDRLRAALPGLAVVAAVGAALVPLLVRQHGNASAAVSGEGSLGARTLQVPKQWLAGYDAPGDRVLAVVAALVLAAGAVVLLRRALPRERRAALLVAGVAAVSALIPLALAFGGVDYLITRNVIVAIAPLLVVAGAGLSAPAAVRGAPARAGAVAVAALCCAWLALSVEVAANPRYQRDDWRGIARALGPPPPGGRAVLVGPASGTLPLALYLPGAHAAHGVATVREIDVVAVAVRRNGSRAAVPRVPPLPSRVGAFLRQPTLRGSTWVAVRYRASAPARVNLDQGAGYGLAGPSGVLLQPAGG